MNIGDEIAKFKKCFPMGLRVAVPMQYRPKRLEQMKDVEYIEFQDFDVSALIEMLIQEIKDDDKIFLSLKQAMNRV